jgi:hypothetical protein
MRPPRLRLPCLGPLPALRLRLPHPHLSAMRPPRLRLPCLGPLPALRLRLPHPHPHLLPTPRLPHPHLLPTPRLPRLPRPCRVPSASRRPESAAPRLAGSRETRPQLRLPQMRLPPLRLPQHPYPAPSPAREQAVERGRRLLMPGRRGLGRWVVPLL